MTDMDSNETLSNEIMDTHIPETLGDEVNEQPAGDVATAVLDEQESNEPEKPKKGARKTKARKTKARKADATGSNGQPEEVSKEDGNADAPPKAKAPPNLADLPFVKGGEGMILDLEDIIADPEIQSRVIMREEDVEDYATAMKDKTNKFPPLEVICERDEKDPTIGRYFLWDGFHRYAAYQLRKVKKVTCNVRVGTEADAKWLSLSANKHNAIRRTRADVQNAIKRAIDAQPLMSDLAISRHVGCDPHTVKSVRKEMGVARDKVVTSSGSVRDVSSYRPDEETPSSGIPAAATSEKTGQAQESKPNLTKAQQARIDASSRVVKDGLGFPVTDPEKRKIAYLYDDMNDTIRDLGLIQNRLHEMAVSTGGRVLLAKLNRAGKKDEVAVYYSNNLKKEIANLTASRPFLMRCPACSHNGSVDPKCKSCHGEDWVTEQAYKDSLPEHKAYIDGLVEQMKAANEAGEATKA